MAPLWTDFSAFWAPRAASPLGQRVPPLRFLRSLRLKSHVALPSYGCCRCGLQPFHNRSSTNSSYLGLFNEARFSQIFLEDILGFIECSSWVYPWVYGYLSISVINSDVSSFPPVVKKIIEINSRWWIRVSDYVCGCVYIIYIPEKGGRKPALSPNLFVSAEKCRGSGHDRSYHPKRPLTIPYEQKPKPSAAPLEDFSLLCNPSPPLPQYHFSSPCKLSCSEPQRTLLSVELRSSSTFLRFPAAFDDFSFIFFRFFQTFLLPFLYFPPFSSSVTSRNLP